jgi:hypothetical protein
MGYTGRAPASKSTKGRSARHAHYGSATQRSAIDVALGRLDVEPMSRGEALAMRGTGWDGDLEQLHGGDTRAECCLASRMAGARDAKLALGPCARLTR